MKLTGFVLLSFFLIQAHAENPTSDREPASYRPKTLTDEIKKQDTREVLPDIVVPTKAIGAGAFIPGWRDFKEGAADRGFEFGLIYKGELNSVLSGGVNQRSTYLENLDVRLNMDLNKVANLKGASFFIYGLGDRGATATNSTSGNVGDYQGTSNIQTGSAQFILYEAWFQQMFFEEKFSVLFGLHDLNSEFYTSDSGAGFLNSNFGVGKDLSQTGINGPSIFPVTSTSLRFKAEPSENVYIQTAVFNAQSGDKEDSQTTHVRAFGDDGLLSITEIGLVNVGQGKSKYALGMWSYDRTFAHLEDPNRQVTSKGTYAVMDYGMSDKSSVFMKYGRASSESNAVGSSIATGFHFENIFSETWHDHLSLGMAQSYFGNEYKRTQEAAGAAINDTETTFELSYRFDILPGVALQPDFQYVISPSGRRDLNDAQVGALRLEINL